MFKRGDHMFYPILLVHVRIFQITHTLEITVELASTLLFMFDLV